MKGKEWEENIYWLESCRREGRGLHAGRGERESEKKEERKFKRRRVKREMVGNDS